MQREKLSEPFSQTTSPMPTQIKICGLTNEAGIDAAAAAGATHIGLVHFEKSSRHLTLKQAADLRKRTPSEMKVALLLVNAEATATDEAIDIVRPDIVQFHGNETPEWTAIVRKHKHVEVWKAFGVTDRHGLVRSDKYQGSVDRLLFDAPAKALPGGNGVSFDWSLLATHAHLVPWGLAGGLDADNVADALRMTRAPLVDASSGLESAPGVKDVDKIAAFCKAVRDYDAARNNA